MADPSPPFMSALMTQAFKKRVPLQSKYKLLLFQNILSISFPPPFSSFRTPIPILLRPNLHAIAPVKSLGSSHCKGKEAIYDPRIEQETGKEAVYSKSDHSDEEKAWHDLDSECAPLINPWYDVHPSFPEIPGDCAAVADPCVARSLPAKPQCFLGLGVFLHLWSSHSLRHFTPCAYPFWI